MRSPPHYRHYEDAIAGIVLIAFAADSVDRPELPSRHAVEHGPGWFPRAMCYIIMGLGVILVAVNLRMPLEIPDEPDSLRLRPLLFVAASCISFGLTLGIVGCCRPS